MYKSKIHFFTVFIPVILIFSSCKHEDQHPVPYVYVNFTINLFDDPEFYRLRTQGYTMVIHNYTIGVLSLGYNDNGVVIYNNGDGEFFAFDCTCPYDLPINSAIDVSNQSGIATCPLCGSQFVFPSMGAPTVDSPSHWPLKEYHAYYNPNTGSLTISN
jgi:hypothetical protein